MIRYLCILSLTLLTACDGGKTAIQLVHTTGLSMTQLRPLLEELVSSGKVAFGQERLGHHGRWLWSLVPPERQRRASCR